MNKKLLLVLVLIMAMLAMVACGGAATPPPAEEPEATAVKTGYAIMTTAGKSVAAGDTDGLAQADSVVVAVTVDADGKIVNIAIDSAQTKINFSKEGKIVTPLDKVFVAKQEMGTDYGMNKASSLGKEWNEQANSFADYVIGKTVAEVKGIAMTDGVATDADLLASVTIKLPGYIAAIEKAVANAQDLGASAGDMIGIGIVTTIDKSKDATAEAEGVAQAYSNYSIVTFDADGVITSCIIDGSQTNVKFDTMGVITTDLAGAFPSKNELGADYGMAKASGIGKEWNEQAAAFAQYVVGKTVADVKGIALTAEGVASDADLAASVTVHIGPFMENIERAYTFAR
jgi:hypothetical protein